MSLGDKTPAQAFAEKMPENESRDEQTNQRYVVRQTLDGRKEIMMTLDRGFTPDVGVNYFWDSRRPISKINTYNIDDQ